jgi:hypothetical protein
VKRIQHITFTYDIACQYWINLLKCFESQFDQETLEMIRCIILLIPKMHLHGHKVNCRYWWSLNYTKCCRQTDGEGIEWGWTEAKKAGGSTKEMNHGHHHDVLSDFQNDWNWGKVQSSSKTSNRIPLGMMSWHHILKRNLCINIIWTILRCSRQRWSISVASVYCVVGMVWLLGPRCPQNPLTVMVNGTMYTGKKTVLLSEFLCTTNGTCSLTLTSYSPKSSKGVMTDAGGQGETGEAGRSLCIHPCCCFFEYRHEYSTKSVCGLPN